MIKLKAKPVYPRKRFDGTLAYEQVNIIAEEDDYPDGIHWGTIHIDCFADHAKELYDRLLVGVEIEIEIKEVDND